MMYLRRLTMALVIMLAAFTMLAALPLLRADVYAAQNGGFPDSTCTWEISDDGTLTIKGDGTLPDASDIGNPPRASSLQTYWPYHQYKSDIKKVVIEGDVKTAENARGMFHGLTNLEEVDLTGLDAKKTYFVHDMFSGCTSLKKITFPGEFLPYQGWRMCKGCTALEEITFGSPDDPFRENDLSRPGTRIPFNQFDGSAGSEAFSGCTSLTTLNMNGGVFHSASIARISNLTKSFGAANDKPKTFNMENATVLGEHPTSPPGTMFKVDTLATLNLKGAVIGENNLRTLFHNVKTNFDIQDYNACPMLETLIMTDVTFAPDNPGRQVSAWMMLSGLKGLKVVEMSGARFPDGVYQHYDYATGPDPACYNFEKMFYDCPKLETVIMGNTANYGLNVEGAQNMKDMFGNCPNLVYLDVSGFGTLPDIRDMNGFLGENSGVAAKKLETLIIDNLNNSAIQVRRDKHPHSNDGRMLFTYGDPSSNLPALKTLSAKNSKVWFVNDNKQGLPGSELYLAANESDMYYVTQKKTFFESDAGPTVNIDTKRNWIDLIKDRDGQSTGSETIPDEGKNINNAEGEHLNTNGAGFLAPGVYHIGEEDWDEEKIDPIRTFYRISTIENSTPEVSVTDNSGNDRIVNNGGNLRTNLYSKDDWDRLFDKDGNDRILKNDDGSPIITITYPDAAQGADGTTRDVILKINAITYKDIDRIKAREGAVQHDPNIYIGDVNDTYSRDILICNTGMLNFRNYLYDSIGNKAISGGSGTYIDFTIEVEDAADGSSVLFYMEDLDVPAKQNYRPGIDPADGGRDWHFGDLPFKVEEGYGNTWGPGSEGMILGTGNDIDTLKFAEHTGLERVNGNEIISTGSDPNTPWSAFAVRASAAGSSYTWTSGVACDTYLLKQTDPPETVGPVYVMPEALKRINGIIPSDTYDGYFKFNLKPANDVANAVNYEGNDEAHSLLNSATAAESDENVTNNGEIIAFKTLKYELPDDKKPRAYIYEITEQEGSMAGDVIKYDTDTKFYMQIVVSPPATDIEMYQGIKAEIITGIKVGDANIIWDTEDVTTVWSDDAVLVTDKQGPDGEQVFKDTQGVEFYRKDGKYYSAEDGSELTPAKHAEVDQKVEYEGEIYDVKVDKNGVEYFVDGDGKYRNPNDHEHELIRASVGDYDPDTVANDSPVAEKKMIDGNEVREDVHGVEYYGTYKDLDGNDLTVEDGVFNPNSGTDKYVYVNKTVDGETVYRHANGKEYYVKNGRYFDAATDEELVPKTAGQVDPLPGDKNATAHEVKEEEQKESITGNEYTVKVDKNGVKYYLNEENNRYYTPYGTLLLEKAGVFEPVGSDPADVFRAEIWIDKEGTRFFKHEGHYYDEDDNRLDKLSDGTVDTSEVVDAGTFHNIIKTSEITIIKETNKAGANNKAGIFKFNVEFDNNFEPEYLVYEPAGSVTKAEQISEDPNIWQFTVEDGQSMSIMQLPFRTSYEIKEVIDADNSDTVNNAFLLTAVDKEEGERTASGKVTSQKSDDDKYNAEYAHTFTNELTEIVVDKTVVKGDKNKDFSFTATMKANGLEPGSNISWGTMDEANNHDFELLDVNDSGEVEAEKTFTLKHGEDIVLVVPKGASVEIVESDAPTYNTTVTIDGTEVPGAKIEVAKDGMKVNFKNDLELTEKSDTKKVTRTITYTEETEDGPEVAATKEQTVSLKKVWYEDIEGNTYDAEGNPIDLGKTPWTIDDSDPDNDQSAVTSPDHPKKKSEGWNPDRAKVDTWQIDLNDPKDEVIHVIYTKDTYTDSEETKTITRTITYTEYTPDGKKVAKTVTQKVTLRRTIRTNDRTGDKTYGNWEIKSGDTSSVKSPGKKGWTPDMTSVPEWEVNLKNPKDEVIHVIYTPKKYTVIFEDGDHGSSSGGSKDKKYGEYPQDNKVTPNEGYRFTGKYSYVITDEDGNIIKTGTTSNPKSIKVIGDIVFTPKYEKIEEKETPKDKDNPTHGRKSGGTRTGDGNSIFIWSMMLIISLLAATAVAVRRRRSE